MGGGFLFSNTDKSPSMKREKLLLAAILLLPFQSTWAFCGFYVAQGDTPLYNQASQVVLAREGDNTVLTMSNDFQGEVKDFAVVIPVPTVIRKDQVRVVEHKLIEHLDAYSVPRLVEYPPPGGCGNGLAADLHGDSEGLGAVGAGQSPSSFGVRVEEAYTVGEYDILLLSARESGGLVAWLKQNGYRLPEGAEPVIGSYLKQDMRFFVAKVNLGEQARLGVQQLRPLQVRYATHKFMLPIRLGTVNARGPQDLVVYTLTRKGRVETANYRTLPMPTGEEIPPLVKTDFGGFYRAVFDRQVEKSGRQAVFTEYFWNLAGRCDPCSSSDLQTTELRDLGADPQAGGIYLTRIHVRYDREHFPEDLVFTETGDTRFFQARYVVPGWVWEHPDRPQGPLRPLYDHLAELTGWSKTKIAGMLPVGNREGQADAPPEPYTDPPVALNALPPEQRQWTTWGGDPAGTRYSPLNLIHRGLVEVDSRTTFIRLAKDR